MHLRRTKLIKYSSEIHAFIAANVEGRTCKELTALINQKFGTSFSVCSIHSYKSRNKFKSHTKVGNPPGESKLFTKEIQEFIKSNAGGIGNAELTVLVNNHFGTKYDKGQIKRYKQRHHISSGLDGRFLPGTIPPNKGKKMPKEIYEKCKLTMFQKGNTPTNHRPIGSERTTKDGYREIKTAEPNKWRLKQIVLWEQYNGPLPKGNKVVFLDGNKENIVIDNLALVTHAELLTMNRSKLKSEFPEITKVGISIAKVKCAIRKHK